MERTIQRPADPEPAILDELSLPTSIKMPTLTPITSVPVSKLNLGGIKGYTEKKKTLKLLKMKQDVIKELRNALDIFDPDEINLNHTAVLFCAQIVEDLFTTKGQGKIKEEVVIEVCKQFFNNDELLIKMVLELVFEKVVKTTVYRRNKEAIKNGLSWLLNMLGFKMETSFSARLKI